jgi:sirohydrochlorin ferrochelatase
MRWGRDENAEELLAQLTAVKEELARTQAQLAHLEATHSSCEGRIRELSGRGTKRATSRPPPRSAR